MSPVDRGTLALAQRRGDWPVLWRAGIPLALFALSLMRRAGELHGPPDEDVRQEAFLALGDALRTWRPDHGALGTYVVPCVRGKVLTWLSNEANHRIGGARQRPVVYVMPPDGFDALVAEGTLDGPPDPLDAVAREHQRRRLTFAFGLLPVEDQALLSHLYGLSGLTRLTADRYALKAGFAPRTVKYHKRQALDRLRRLLR